MLTKAEFAQRIKNACLAVIAAEAELTEIDAKFGDADHGFTMAKVCNAILAAIEESDGGIQTLLDDAAMAVMAINAIKFSFLKLIPVQIILLCIILQIWGF